MTISNRFFSNKNHDSNANSKDTINLPKNDTNDGRVKSNRKILNMGKCHK